MRQLLQSYIPPLLLNKLVTIVNHIYFIKYRSLVKLNSSLKNTHSGDRCFILGSGPSINTIDLTPLKDEIVFALNNFYVHKDFSRIMDGSVPKYYLSAPIHPPQKEEEWTRWLEDMDRVVPADTTILFGLNRNRINIKYILDKNNFFRDKKVFYYFAGIRNGEFYKLHNKNLDLSSMTWTARTASIYALVAAIYMNFKKIYLLGMDHNYFCIEHEKDFRFYKKAIHQENEQERTRDIHGQMSKNTMELKFMSEVFFAYNHLQQRFPDRIYNLTYPSVLDVFKKQDFETVINNKGAV